MFRRKVLGYSLVLTAFTLILAAFFLFWKLLLPFLFSFVLYFAFKPVLLFFEHRGMKHFTSVLLVFLGVFGGFAIFLSIFIPAIHAEFLTITANLETYSASFSLFIRSLQESLSTSPIGSFLLVHASGFLRPDAGKVSLIVQDIAGKLPSAVSSFFLFLSVVPFATFFFLLDARRIERRLISLVPNRYFEITLDLLHNLGLQFGYILRGMLLSVCIVSLLSSAGLWLIGLDYPLLIGIFAGVSNLIPYAGPVVGILGACMVAVMTGSPGSLYISIFVVFFLVQLLDNTLVQPMVMARSTNLHPLAVLFLVLLGSSFGGVMGMFVIVPLVSLFSVIFRIISTEFARPPRPDFFSLPIVPPRR